MWGLTLARLIANFLPLGAGSNFDVSQQKFELFSAILTNAKTDFRLPSWLFGRYDFQILHVLSSLLETEKGNNLITDR